MNSHKVIPSPHVDGMFTITNVDDIPVYAASDGLAFDLWESQEEAKRAFQVYLNPNGVQVVSDLSDGSIVVSLNGINPHLGEFIEVNDLNRANQILDNILVAISNQYPD